MSPAWPSLYREPLRLVGALPRGGSCSHDLDRHYPAFIATPGSCAGPQPSGVLRSKAWYPSLCRLLRAPAGRRPFPMLSPQSVWRRLGPYPAALRRCIYPVSSRRTSASPHMQQVRRADTIAMIAISMTDRFRGCSHSVMFRLPHLLDPQIAPTAEALCLLSSRAVYATQ